jgi:hypothetical protein
VSGLPRAASLAALLLAGAAAAEPVLPAQRLTYAASWNGLPLGDVVMSLQPHGAPDCYRYESATDPYVAYQVFYGKPVAASEFCIRDGRVVPQRFTFDNPKTGERSSVLEFDVAGGKVRNGKGGVHDIPANAQDRLALQQAVRLWAAARGAQLAPGGESVEFVMVDDRYVRRYRFQLGAREAIDTPAGRFETLRMERVDDPKRSSIYWLAPARDYLPVQLEQGRGFNSVRLALKTP